MLQFLLKLNKRRSEKIRLYYMIKLTTGTVPNVAVFAQTQQKKVGFFPTFFYDKVSKL